jgi:hypothetical protein
MKFSVPVKILLLVLLVLVGWNYWLPTAENQFNHVAEDSENHANDVQNVDFLAYFTAGQRFNSGDNPYFWGKDAQGNTVFSDFLYPPAVLPVFGLIAHLKFNQARVLWLCLYTLAYLLVFGWMSLSFVHSKRFTFLVIGLVLTLVSWPLLSHILVGQADVFIICLILGSYLFYASGRRFAASIFLAIATLLKVSPLFLLIYFVIFLKDFRFLMSYLAAILVMAAASLLFVPFGFYLDYILRVLPEVGKGTPFWLNQSLLTYLSYSPILARIVSLTGLGAFAVLAWVIGRRIKLAGCKAAALPLGEKDFPGEMLFILNLAWILIFIGKAWPATYVWLILPSAWLLTSLVHQPASPGYLAAIALGVILVMSKNYGFPVLSTINLWGNLILTASLTFGLLTKKLLPRISLDTAIKR